MKYFLLLIIGIGSLSFGKDDTPAASRYFYCNSHALKPKPGVKQTILYTEVKSIDQAEVAATLKKWREMVDNNCGNQGDCNSEINTYGTLEMANEELKKYLNARADTSRFIIKKLSL